jgi:hypothetical protein
MLSLIARAQPDKNFQCWPSCREICLDTGLEAHAVFNAMSKLENGKHLIVWRKTGCRNHYGLSPWIDPDLCTQSA